MAKSSKRQTKSIQKRWLQRGLWAIAIFVVVVFLGCLGLSTYVGWDLTHPDHYALTNFPDSLELSYEDIQFTSPDQIQLKGWLFQSKENNDKLIVFAHGYSNNRSYEVGSLPTVQALLAAGYDCLMFDFRNSGLSEGELTSIGQFEKLDVLAAVDYGKSRGYQHFGVVGFSMGAVTAALAAAESPDIQAVVLDSPFAALRPYLEANLSVWSHLPDFPFTPMVLWVTPSLIGVDPEQVRPIDLMEKLRGRGVLLIHAKGDPRIPAANSEQLYTAIGSEYAELYLTDANKHVGSYEMNPTIYKQKIIALFDQYVK